MITLRVRKSKLQLPGVDVFIHGRWVGDIIYSRKADAKRGAKRLKRKIKPGMCKVMES